MKKKSDKMYLELIAAVVYIGWKQEFHSMHYLTNKEALYAVYYAVIKHNGYVFENVEELSKARAAG